MIGLIDKQTRALTAIVYSTEGYDLAQFDQVQIDVDPREHVWNVATETMVPRPATAGEMAATDLLDSPRWQALRHASPAQIRNWINSNVQNLGDAREVLALLVLALQSLSERVR